MSRSIKKGRSMIKNVMDISKKEQERRLKEIKDFQNTKEKEKENVIQLPPKIEEEDTRDINLRKPENELRKPENEGILEFDSNIEEGFKIPNVTKESIYDFRDNVEYEEPKDKDKKNFEIV